MSFNLTPSPNLDPPILLKRSKLAHSKPLLNRDKRTEYPSIRKLEFGETISVPKDFFGPERNMLASRITKTTVLTVISGLKPTLNGFIQNADKILNGMS